MGVVYKLKPEITDFILSTRKNNPRLGCRAIASLVEKKYKTPVSKSSVSDVIKSTGLSMPVGRRRKSRRNEVFGRGLGTILLKAADYLLGGTQGLAEAIKKRSDLPLADIRTGLEYLLYSPLFGASGNAPLESGLWPLINRTAQPGDIVSLARKLQEKDVLSSETARDFFTCVNSVRSIKVVLSDSAAIYLDGQLHTVWPQPKIPYKFSTTVLQARLLAHDYAQGRSPLAFFMAPGYDAPTKEFFNFLKSTVSLGNNITAITLLDSNAQELEELKLSSGKREHFFFGLWPWQFSGLKKITLAGEFKAFYFEPLKESFHIAPVSVELFQDLKEEAVALKGCALKIGPDEDIRLLILTNSPPQADPPAADSLDNSSLDNFMNIYLENWPNFESTFQDLSRKIELKDQSRSFEEELQSLARHGPLSLEEMLKDYLEILNLFVVFYFLPPVYRDAALSTMKDRFYSLNAAIKAQKGYSSVVFQPPEGYPFLKELAYACRRLNEKKILFQEGQKAWFLL
ncbi:MAG: hypothetical protein NTU54_08245 [Candidatus Omnitrophica bacterium]|nr:hypothetical protein [Candidatus Omnitrophota bacterium]